MLARILERICSRLLFDILFPPIGDIPLAKSLLRCRGCTNSHRTRSAVRPMPVPLSKSVPVDRFAGNYRDRTFPPALSISRGTYLQSLVHHRKQCEQIPVSEFFVSNNIAGQLLFAAE